MSKKKPSVPLSANPPSPSPRRKGLNLAGMNLAPLADAATWLTVTAERAVSRAMGGSCSMPLAAHATLTDGVLHLQAAWGDPSGAPVLLRAEVKQALNSADPASRDAANALGESVAAQLRAQGAH